MVRKDRIVIGSSVEAMFYALQHKLPIMYSRFDIPHCLDFLPPNDMIKHIGLENKISELLTINYGCKKIGTYKRLVWQKLFFLLSFNGLNFTGQSPCPIFIEDNVVQQSKVRRHSFDEIIVFDDKDIFGLPISLSVTTEEIKIFDWFNVRRSGNHKLDYIVDNDNRFVNEILFYISTRNYDCQINFKDLVATSYAKNKEELESEDYSDVSARFKIMQMMKDSGIKGVRNGRDMRDKSRFKYYLIRIQHDKREVINLGKNFYEDTNNMKFKYYSYEEALTNFVDSIDYRTLRLMKLS